MVGLNPNYQGGQWEAISRIVHGTLGRSPDASLGYGSSGVMRSLMPLLHSPDEFWEMLEALLRAMNAVSTTAQRPLLQQLIDKINEMLILDHLAYRVDAHGLILDSGSDPENAAIDEARSLLAGDSRFANADGKFTAALAALARQDERQYHAAAGDAVSALEDVCRKLLDEEKVTLDRALDRIREQTDIHPTLIESVRKAYGYRGDQPGAAHGAGTAPEYQARFVVHTVAAAITMIIAATDAATS